MATAITFGTSGGLVDVDNGLAETVAGSYIGDVLVNGTLGLMLAYWLSRIFRRPGPLTSTDARARAAGGHTSYRSFLVLTWLVHQATPLLLLWDTGKAEGFLANTIVQAVLLFVVYPYMLLGPKTHENDTLLWAPDYAFDTRVLFFWSWGAVVLAVHVPLLVGIPQEWLANDWYIVWLFGGIAAVVLVVIAVGAEVTGAVIPGEASMEWRVLLQVALGLLMGALALLVARGITGTLWIGTAGFVLGVIALLLLLLVAGERSKRRSTPAAPPLVPSDRALAFALKAQ